MSLLVTSPHSPASARLPGANAARREATITAAASRKLFFPPAASHGPKAQKSERKKNEKKRTRGSLRAPGEPRNKQAAWEARATQRRRMCVGLSRGKILEERGDGNWVEHERNSSPVHWRKRSSGEGARTTGEKNKRRVLRWN